MNSDTRRIHYYERIHGIGGHDDTHSEAHECTYNHPLSFSNIPNTVTSSLSHTRFLSLTHTHIFHALTHTYINTHNVTHIDKHKHKHIHIHA